MNETPVVNSNGNSVICFLLLFLFAACLAVVHTLVNLKMFN